MALPKEPRQKMINMMYLVLTALLALNVSAEILIAFRTVNESITEANRVISDKNNTTYNSFNQKLEDPKTKDKAAIWAPKAFAAQKLSDSIYQYLEDLKLLLKQESGLRVDENGTEQFKEDNLDAPTRLMVTEKRGEELQAKLQSFKDQMLAIVPEKKEEFEKSLPLDLKKPTGTRSAGNDDWASAYFRMTPTIAAITILSKFQNDVKNSEAQIVDYCHNQIGQVEVIFDAFQAFAGTNSKYLMPGEELEITAGIGSFSKAAQPTVYINGTPQQLNADGAAVWKTRVEGVGNKVVNVKIEYTKPDGTKDVAERKVEYTVGVPSGASIFLEKMNVMYLGVDNPVTISGGSVGSEKVSVTFTGGTITKAGGDRYIAKPSKTGEEKIVVTADGKRYEFPIRCKLLPDPAVMVGTSSGGPMSAATFKAQGGLIARLKDSDFDASFKVVSYTLGAKGGPLSNYQQFSNEGPRWTGNAGNLIERVGPGSDVFFDDIRVQGPDGRVRSIPSIAFQLK